MAYVSPNFKTKKELKKAVKNGRIVRVFSPGPFSCEQDGVEYIEGPHYPAPHRWGAEVAVRKGVVIRVK